MLPPNSRENQAFQNTLDRMKPSIAFVAIIFGALIAFEIFNYSTTDHALHDLLGDLTFIGLPWSTILALAFCGIDFAGIARLFTPEQGMDEPKEVWYLFGAWLLAATMNAILTWWGVSMAVSSHPVTSSKVVDPATITQVVPVFVAIMVWVIRILIIGTLSLALDRLLHPGAVQRSAIGHQTSRTQAPSGPSMNIPSSLGSAGIPPRPSMSRAARPAGQPSPASNRSGRFSPPTEDAENIFDTPARPRPEPTYHSVSGSARQPVNTGGANGNTNPDRFRRS